MADEPNGRRNGLPYYKRYPRDFIEGTLQMSFELKGAYSILLDLIYMQKGSLPDNPQYIAGLLGTSVRKWNLIREQLIELGKIHAISGLLTNYRADKELISLGTFSDRQSINATGTRKIKGLTKATAKPEKSHTEPDSEIEEKEPSVPKRRASRLSPEWAPSEADKDWLRAKWVGVTGTIYNSELEKFRNYWLAKSGKDAAKLDWSRTWQNWMLNAQERAGSRPQPKQHATDILANLIGEMENAERLASEGIAPTDQQYAIPGPRKRDD